jgi:hypothetical protein
VSEGGVERVGAEICFLKISAIGSLGNNEGEWECILTDENRCDPASSQLASSVSLAIHPMYSRSLYTSVSQRGAGELVSW